MCLIRIAAAVDKNKQDDGLQTLSLKMIVVIVLVFYGPSTYFWSFRARSVNLATLFLAKPPRQFTSIQSPFFRQYLTNALLESVEG